MATTARARRGRSGERAFANARMDFQAETMDELAALGGVRHRLPAAECARQRLQQVYVGTLRPLQRVYQAELEQEIARAEGYGVPRVA